MILTGPGSFPYLIVEFGAAFEHKSSLRINHRAPSWDMLSCTIELSNPALPTSEQIIGVSY